MKGMLKKLAGVYKLGWAGGSEYYQACLFGGVSEKGLGAEKSLVFSA